MPKQIFLPLVATTENNQFLTVVEMPGTKIAIVDPFRSENHDDHFFEIGHHGSIGRIKPPAQYQLFGKNGNEALNRLKKKAGQNAHKAFQKTSKSIDQFDGVGERTLVALETAGLITPQLIYRAGVEGLKLAGVHRSLIKQILKQADDVVSAEKTANSYQRTVQFFEKIARTSHYGLELRVYVEPELSKNILFYSVDGRKNLTKAKLRIENDFGGAMEPHFRKKVQVKKADNERWQGAYHTEAIEDTLRYAYVTTDGILHSGDISIVSQGGEFFLNIQEIYTMQVYKKGSTLIFPEFEARKRFQFCKFFNEHLPIPTGTKLPHIAKHKHMKKFEFDLHRLAENQLFISYFSVAQRLGEGVKLDSAGQKMFVRIHFSEIEADGIARLDKGDIVTFRELIPLVKTSKRETWEGYQFQATGVRYVYNERDYRRGDRKKKNRTATETANSQKKNHSEKSSNGNRSKNVPMPRPSEVKTA